jgi:uncharacterized protein (DUF2126 family)/transglutaminase-like putative cysteine protease
VRLRPASHARAKIETYGLHIEQPHNLRWQQDPQGNHVARVSFDAGVLLERLDLLVELAIDIKAVNPFDFFLDQRAENVPFAYPAEIAPSLAPFLRLDDPALAGGPRLRDFLASLPSKGPSVPLVVEINRLVNERVRYVIREEAGVYTPEETLAHERGSCRDSAVLLVAALRSRGLAARFVSGYLVQLTDEGMIPDEPRGVPRDVVDLHAWAEVFLPGAGWLGLDATSGLLCGEGHIPLACTPSPAAASPIEGTSDVLAEEVSFQMTVARLGHEPRPTKPYEEPVYEAMLAAGDDADRRLEALGVRLTMGGEPTFNSRLYPDRPEWNEDALGPTKASQGLALARELRRRLAPSAAMLHRMGKWYPGESLPRWALDVCGRKDGSPVWSDLAEDGKSRTTSDAERLARAIAARLDLERYLVPAFEDPWRHLQDEASLPVDVDPLAADVSDPEERRRLARVLDRGLGAVVGYVLPLTREDARWTSEAWRFRRERLYLLPGDSPLGLRLPLRSLSAGDPVPPTYPEVWIDPPDPRRASTEEEVEQLRLVGRPPARRTGPARVRTALAVEAREGRVYVFLPPLWTAGDFFALLAEVGAAQEAAHVPVLLEGYPAPSSPEVFRFSVTPDPGVLEVNLPPTSRAREHAGLMDTVFEAALHAGLHCEKYLLDGRQAGSGGGNHVTLGGPTPLESPFLQRPDLLASLLTFAQHHPSLSYAFTGLFVGPTSQAPRVDEARHDALYELEIALDRAFQRPDEPPPPWLSDMLFRHLLVDVAGNTHRTELCIDKLFDPGAPHGRQGLVELRAFEMPPHHRMAVAQALLLRCLVTAFAEEPYRHGLVRWGTMLHDRFLLPYWLGRDLDDVLDFLASRGLSLPREGYQPFVDLRCPLAGTMQAGDVTVEVRNAIEPWHVLGEEMTSAGTSRYVDSSMERVEVRAEGLIPERHAVLVNGHVLPMRPTGKAGEAVAGVRFRAWAPPHSLQPHLGIHHPIRVDVVDRWARRSLGAAGYHVWHPEGRAFDAPPLTRFEATARRAQRFTREGPLPFPVDVRGTTVHPEAAYTLDLRRYPIDRPMPEPREEIGELGLEGRAPEV